MNKSMVCAAGLLIAAAATAAVPAGKAVLTGRKIDRSFPGAALLICQYDGAHARFEILSRTGDCAPYLDVE